MQLAEAKQRAIDSYKKVIPFLDTEITVEDITKEIQESFTLRECLETIRDNKIFLADMKPTKIELTGKQ